MSYRITQQNEYIASSASELPAIAAEQKQNKNDYPYGVLVFVVDEASVYCLNQNGTWTKI